MGLASRFEEALLDEPGEPKAVVQGDVPADGADDASAAAPPAIGGQDELEVVPVHIGVRRERRAVSRSASNARVLDAMAFEAAPPELRPDGLGFQHARLPADGADHLDPRPAGAWGERPPIDQRMLRRRRLAQLLHLAPTVASAEPGHQAALDSPSNLSRPADGHLTADGAGHAYDFAAWPIRERAPVDGGM